MPGCVVLVGMVGSLGRALHDGLRHRVVGRLWRWLVVHVLRRRLERRLLVQVGHMLLHGSSRPLWWDSRRHCMLQGQRRSLLRQRRLLLGQGHRLLSAWGVFVLQRPLLHWWCLLAPLPLRRIRLLGLVLLVRLLILVRLPGPRWSVWLLGACVVALAVPGLVLLLVVLVVSLLLLLVLQVSSIVWVHPDQWHRSLCTLRRCTLGASRIPHGLVQEFLMKAPHGLS